MPHIAEHLFECPITRKRFGTGLLMPKPQRKKLVSAADVMPIYSRAEIIAKLKAAGGTIGLAVGLPATNQGQHPLCWDWSMCQMVEVVLLAMTGAAVRLDVSIAPVEDHTLNEGNDIHAAWVDGIEPYGICPAAFMGTDPTATSDLPDMLTSLSRFPAGWQAEAAKRKGVERYECATFLEMASAILNGHPCVLGVDCEGGGHAIGSTTIILGKNGGLSMQTPGTWGADYKGGWAGGGPAGTYTLSEAQTEAAFNGGYGCQALIAVRDDEDAPVPAAA